jgi:hypothetical protein
MCITEKQSISPLLDFYSTIKDLIYFVQVVEEGYFTASSKSEKQSI